MWGILRLALKCRALPLPATALQSGSRLAQPQNQSGGCDERTSSRHIAARETARRPAGFVEGNRGVPPSRRENGPTLGEAGGDARSPPPARQARLGLRVGFGT